AAEERNVGDRASAAPLVRADLEANRAERDEPVVGDRTGRRLEVLRVLEVLVELVLEVQRALLHHLADGGVQGGRHLAEVGDEGRETVCHHASPWPLVSS